MHARTLGVDPGSTTGAAALLADGEVTAWLAWTCTVRGFRIRSAGLSAPLVVPHLHDVATELHRLGPFRLVLEGLFLAHGNSRASKGKRRSLLPLAESAGELLGPLRGAAVGNVLRPNAQREWRPDVLGLPPDTNDKEAEERAVAWAKRNLLWAHPLDESRLSYAEEGAICEAACMAVWGYRQKSAAA